MENNSSPGNQTDWRYLRNFAIAILLIVVLMLCYYFMLVKNDLIFGRFNDLIGFIGILCLHLIVIFSAFNGEKRQPGTEKRTKINGATKPVSLEEIARNKKGRKKTIRRVILAFILLIIIDIALILLWRAPIWLRWVVIFFSAGVFTYSAYSLSKRYGERRGLYSALGQLGLVFLGWLLGRWLGIIFISMPLLLIYYGMLYSFAMVIVPANNPDAKLVLFDKGNEKWQRFLLFVWYTWGIQHPMNVVADDTGREVSMRIPGSPFRSYGLPGIILTRTHQVVGITAGTEFSRVDGPGIVFTKRFERPLEIVDLRRQVRSSWIDVVTKDGIPFKAKLFMVFKINDSSPDHTEGSFPYSKKWVRRLLKLLGVVQTQPNEKTKISWEERVVKQIEQTAQQVLSKRTLNKLWEPQDSSAYSSAFVEIGEEIKSTLQERLEEQGIVVFTSRMVNFKFSEEKEDTISSQQLQTWQSSWARQAHQTIAAGNAEAARLQEEARAYAQSVLLKAFVDGIKQTTPGMSRSVIAIRFIGAIQELMKKEPAVAEELGADVTARLENIRQRINPP